MAAIFGLGEPIILPWIVWDRFQGGLFTACQSNSGWTNSDWSTVYTITPRMHAHDVVSVCVYVCMCVDKKIFKNTSSRVARVFKDIKLNENNQWNHVGTFMYLTQVEAALFTIISATSYYRFLGSTPFKIAHGI